MNQLWSEFDEWIEYESSFTHTRVWNHQARIFDHDVTIQKQIDIDNAGAVFEGPLAPEFALNATDTPQCGSRREIGLGLHDHVQEPRLIQEPHRRGLVTRRLAEVPEAGVRQSCDCRVEDRLAIP